MELHICKLRPMMTDHDGPSFTASPEAPPPTNQLNLNAHFNTCTVIVFFFLALLTSLFFMGSISLYIRRLSSREQNESTFFLSARQRHRSNRRITGPPVRQTSKSLPAFAYAKQQQEGIESGECVICLGELEEGEAVRMVAKCMHVFHVECIDTWLKIRVSCPVCRETRFL